MFHTYQKYLTSYDENENKDNRKKKSKKNFKLEKIKEKDNIFELLKEHSKKSFKKDYFLLNKNKKLLLHSMSILKNANIDEGFILSKYYAYLKNCRLEHDQFIKRKIKGLLMPIKEKEKDIKNMKKNIYFYKSISNQMLLKYMIDKQQKLNGYIEEIYSSRNKNSENSENSEYNQKYNHTQKTQKKIINTSSNKKNSRINSALSERNNHNSFLTSSKKYNINNYLCKDSYIREEPTKDNNKKIIPKLQLKKEETKKGINNYFYKNNFLDLYSRNKNKFNYNNNKALTTTYTNNNPISLDKKSNTPQIMKKRNKIKANYLNNEKNNYKINYFSKSSRKVMKCDVNKIFKKSKIKKLNYLTFE
jgi:hypothetical protein